MKTRNQPTEPAETGSQRHGRPGRFFLPVEFLTGRFNRQEKAGPVKVRFFRGKNRQFPLLNTQSAGSAGSL